MKIRFTRITVLATVLVLSAATTAAFAQSDETGPAGLEVGANVLASDAYGIYVDAFGEGGLWFQAEVNSSSGPQEFGMGILNTTAYGWSVEVSGTDLQAFTEQYDCDDQGWNCTYTFEGPTISADRWIVSGGDDGTGEVTAYTSVIGTDSVSTGFVMNEGTASAYGNFGLGNPNPTLELSVPDDATLAGNQYHGTLTFTMTLDIPAP